MSVEQVVINDKAIRAQAERLTATIKGRDIRPGNRLADYSLGGDFLVERIDRDAHRTAAGEMARCAYDHAGRGLVVFCDDTYRLIHMTPDVAHCRGCAADRKAAESA